MNNSRITLIYNDNQQEQLMITIKYWFVYLPRLLFIINYMYWVFELEVWILGEKNKKGEILPSPNDRIEPLSFLLPIKVLIIFEVAIKNCHIKIYFWEKSNKDNHQCQWWVVTLIESLSKDFLCKTFCCQSTTSLSCHRK